MAFPFFFSPFGMRVCMCACVRVCVCWGGLQVMMGGAAASLSSLSSMTPSDAGADDDDDGIGALPEDTEAGRRNSLDDFDLEAFGDVTVSGK